MRVVFALLCIQLLTLVGCATPNPIALTPSEVREAPEDYVVLAVNNAPSHYAHAGSTSRTYTTSNYLQSAEARSTLQAIAAEYELKEITGWPIAALSMHCVVFKLREGASRAELIEKLQHDSRVALAQPLQTFATNTSATSPYNDPYASMQSNLDQMGIRDAHQWSLGTDVRIAVIDTGVDVTHPDLQGRVVAGRNFVDKNSMQSNVDRHGTEIAGVIAANVNNHVGIVGVAPQAKLYVFKACWQLKPERDEAMCNSFTLAEALAAAIDSQVQIINLSLVGPADPLLAALIRRAQQSGIIIVGAASATDGFPAQLSDVIGVGSFEDNASSSTLVRAPGHDVMTLLPGGRYDFSSGNSIATAETTGAIALLIAGAKTNLRKPSAVADLRKALQTGIGTDELTHVNACLALSQLVQHVHCRTETALSSAYGVAATTR